MIDTEQVMKVALVIYVIVAVILYWARPQKCMIECKETASSGKQKMCPMRFMSCCLMLTALLMMGLFCCCDNVFQKSMSQSFGFYY